MSQTLLEKKELINTNNLDIDIEQPEILYENPDLDISSISIDCADEISDSNTDSLDSLVSEELRILDELNTTNCLALTIKKDYKLIAVKNIFIKTLKISWKVIISTLTLNFIKFFLH